MGDEVESTDPASAPFSQEQTLTCLRRAGATIGPLRPSDQHRRAFRDLAQDRTVEVRRGSTTVALAFARDVAAADLLVELLAVPGNPYEIVSRGNVVMLYRPEVDATSVTASCLE